VPCTAEENLIFERTGPNFRQAEPLCENLLTGLEISTVYRDSTKFQPYNTFGEAFRWWNPAYSSLNGLVDAQGLQ